MQELEQKLEAARVSKGKKLSKGDVDTMLERLQQQRAAPPPVEPKPEELPPPSKKLSKTDLDRSVSRLYAPPTGARAGRWTEHTAPLRDFASPYADMADRSSTSSKSGSAWALALRTACSTKHAISGGSSSMITTPRLTYQRSSGIVTLLALGHTTEAPCVNCAPLTSVHSPTCTHAAFTRTVMVQ